MNHHNSDRDQQFADDRLASLAPAAEWAPDSAGQAARMHTKRAAGQRARNMRTAAVLAVVLVFVSVPVTRAFGARCLEACVNATSLVSQLWNPTEPLAHVPKSVGASIGALAADPLGKDASGQPVSLSKLRGHVVLVNFWATWCPPCRAEMPLLSDLQARFDAQGLEVVGVSLDEDGWRAIDPFLAQAPVRYRVTLGDDEVAAAYEEGTLPATFVIDAQGVIVAKMSGALHAGQYDALIARLLR
jgi:cytochrome c biogenesis protein CcmG/thiol:disulfide interchange protein DsbE